MLTPRYYQTLAADHAEAWLKQAKPGQRQLYAAPTGTGKSLIELMVLGRFPHAYLVTPRVEIIAGLLDKMGVGHLPARTAEIGEQLRIYTPVRLRNRLAQGTITQPAQLIIDEGHHWLTSVTDELDALTGEVPAVAFTATPFRGTPKATAKYLQQWGEPQWIISFAEAAEGGYLSVPTCRVVPLVDDDTIEVTSSGEFVVRQVSEAVVSRLDAVVDMARAWCRGPFDAWDRPTMFSVPSVETARDLTSRLHAANMTALCVTGETPAALRDEAFRHCVIRAVALVQINVVSEGVDLPIRRLVDLHPSMSPVWWQQQFGRITRPVAAGEAPPEYICCNRNLLRHAYLLDGCLPPATMKAAEEAFATPSKRMGVRVVGFEGLGRFKATELPLSNGTTGVMYCLSAVEGSTVTQYAVIASPNRLEPIAAKRENVRQADGTSKYGRWQRVDRVPQLDAGFASVPPSPLSDKMSAWWGRSAANFGLDASAKVNRRSFAALPVLADIRGKL